MYDMILGPLGKSAWAGPAAMPRAEFHHDWSRVCFAAGATVNPLTAFSYKISDAAPAAIVAAIPAPGAANILDTSLGKENSLSRDCVATHLGVKIDNVALVTAGDVALTQVAVNQCVSRLLVKVFYGDRNNMEFMGKIEDLPEGKGYQYNTPALGGAVWWAAENGVSKFTNVRPLPQPLPCEGGLTLFGVTFEPTRKGVGITCASITSIRTDVYGVRPPDTNPAEAEGLAFAALKMNQH